MGGSNLIGSRLSTLKSLHKKGITKLQIPSKKAQLSELASGNVEELKILEAADVVDGETQQKGFFQRYLPSIMLSRSPSMKSTSTPRKGSGEKKTWEY